MTLDWLPPLPEPHPDLVALQRPSPADVALAAAVFGWLPEDEDRLPFRSFGAVQLHGRARRDV